MWFRVKAGEINCSEKRLTSGIAIGHQRMNAAVGGKRRRGGGARHRRRRRRRRRSRGRCVDGADSGCRGNGGSGGGDDRHRGGAKCVARRRGCDETVVRAAIGGDKSRVAGRGWSRRCQLRLERADQRRDGWLVRLSVQDVVEKVTVGRHFTSHRSGARALWPLRRGETNGGCLCVQSPRAGATAAPTPYDDTPSNALHSNHVLVSPAYPNKRHYLRLTLFSVYTAASFVCLFFFTIFEAMLEIIIVFFTAYSRLIVFSEHLNV